MKTKNDIYSADTDASSHQMLNSIQKEITFAIQKGAPLYNSGDIVGCEMIYIDLFTAMLDPSSGKFHNLKLYLPNVHKNLMDTKEKLEQSDNSNARNSTSDKNAWKLRNCFDSILEIKRDNNDQNYSSFPQGPNLQMVPIEFRGTGVSILNDSVMGGISNSTWKDGIFQGTVRLDNNGGFASLRLRFKKSLNLNHFDGFYIKACNLMGSQMRNQEFCLIIKDSTCIQSMATNFKMKFTPETGNIVSLHKISAKVLNMPESFGRPRNDRWNCDMRKICEIGVMAIKPGVVGDFKLKIDQVGFYKDPVPLNNTTTARKQPTKYGQEKTLQSFLCGICLEDVEKRVVLQPCGHANFCLNCIIELETKSEKKCPMCNAKFISYQQIYI